MPVLQLPACPICGATDSLVRQVLDRADHPRTAYGCWECGSVLVWLGDDLWLQSDRWAYQHVGRAEKRHLLHRPMTAADLRRLAESTPGLHPWSDGDETVDEIDGLDAATGQTYVEEEAEFTPPPPPRQRPEPPPRQPPRQPPQQPPRETPRGPARGPAPDAPREGERRYDLFDLREGGAALVPMAQILPEGMKLALVRYDGLRAEPVAIFHEGELRAIPATPPRSKGSPLLWIGVALTLLCFACAASAVVVSGFLEGGLPVAMPAPVGALAPTNTQLIVPTLSPTQTPLPTDTPVPTDTPQPTDTPIPTPTPEPTAVVRTELQGVTAYVPAPGSLVIVGEVLNDSEQDLRFVEIVGTFFDGGGTLVGTDSTYAALMTVEEGSRAPFRLMALGLPPSLANYDLRVNYVVTDEDPLRVEVLSQRAFRGEGGVYHIVGEVRNPYDHALSSVDIVATYYDAAYQVVRVEKTTAQAGVLEPGQVSPFELVLANPPSELSHYRLQTEAVQP
jgi:hypothetical protein